MWQYYLVFRFHTSLSLVISIDIVVVIVVVIDVVIVIVIVIVIVVPMGVSRDLFQQKKPSYTSRTRWLMLDLT